MLNLSQFVAGLFPLTDKSDLLERIGNIIDEIEEVVIPSYANYNAVFKNSKINSAPAKTLESVIKDVLPSKDPFGVIVEKALQEAVQNLKMIRQFVQKDRADVFSKDAMRYKTASIMKLVELASFATIYAPKLINYVVTAETLESKGQIGLLNHELAPAEIDYITGNIGNFTLALKALSNDHRDTLRTLENGKELIITGDKETDSATESMANYKDIDPLNVGFISLQWNIFWHIGKAYINWRAKRYHAALEERQLLEVRLLTYKQYLETKGSDARLEARCREAQARVNALNKEIANMEKSWKK